MATQGLISIVDGNGKVRIKIVAGCDGFNAIKLAARIKAKKLTDLQSIYDAALAFPFGSESSLVVMNKDEFIYAGDDSLPVRYFQTFDDPHFNPRWHYGTADFTKVIKMSRFNVERNK